MAGEKGEKKRKNKRKKKYYFYCMENAWGEQTKFTTNVQRQILKLQNQSIIWPNILFPCLAQWRNQDVFFPARELLLKWKMSFHRQGSIIAASKHEQCWISVMRKTQEVAKKRLFWESWQSLLWKVVPYPTPTSLHQRRLWKLLSLKQHLPNL